MRTFHEDRSRRSVRYSILAAAVTMTLLGFSAKTFAQSIKVGYAALVAGQIAVWIAKEGGYLANSRDDCHPGVDRRRNPAGASYRGLHCRGDLIRGGR